MSTFPFQIPTKENKRIKEVGVVGENGDVVDPGLDSVSEPFGVECGFEDEGVGGHEAAEAGGPAVAVDLITEED